MEATARLRDCLDRLGQRLAHLDHDGIDACAAELAALADRFPFASADTPELQALLDRVRQTAALGRAAADLYAGWMHLAAPPGVAYTVDGLEPLLHMPHRSLAWQG